MIHFRLTACFRLVLAAASLITIAHAADRVKVEGGVLEGTVSSDPSIRLFKGVFMDTLKQQFKDMAEQAPKLYPASTDEEARQSAADLASDGFIVFSTWKWMDMHLKTGKAPVYRFLFSRFTPPADGAKAYGAAHAAEIPYAFNSLDLYKDAKRAPEDRQTAQTMAAYWANFIKTGNPGAAGLPQWPEFGKTGLVMTIDVVSKAEPEKHKDRYEFMDRINGK